MYAPAADQAVDSTAITNCFEAVDAANTATWGNGVLSGLTCNSSGEIVAGQALIGHLVAITAATTLVTSFIGSDGTWYVYLQAQEYAADGTTTLGVPGSYPGSNGVEVGRLVAVASGVPSGAPSTFLCSVVISSGAFVSATNAAPLVTRWLVNQAVTGTCNGTNVTFTLPTAANQLVLFQTGLLLRPSAYSLASNGVTLTMTTAPGGPDWLMAMIGVVA